METRMEIGTEIGMEMEMTMGMEATIQEVKRDLEVRERAVETVKGTDIASYAQNFQELALLCSRMLPKETDKVERFIRGLPDSIQGNVTSFKSTRLQEEIEIANSLMDQKVRVYGAIQAENKRRMDNNPRDNHAQQPPYKRQNVARADTNESNERKEYAGSVPLCNKCKLHHNGPCTAKLVNWPKIVGVLLLLITREPWGNSENGYML
ncbi:hypothetical protein Tco_0483534 [Tanacetum coccineum]